MSEKKLTVAVVGATGVVGEALLEILAERQFPVQQLFALASEQSAGKQMMFAGKNVMVQEVSTFDFTKADIALFSAGKEVAKIYAPIAADSGCVVIDNSSYFRYQPEVPLVVPEVNPEKIADYKNTGIIANPNCSTIQMLVALKPIYDAVGIQRINVSTYQAVSGSGKAALEELATQTARLLNGLSIKPSVYPQQIAFNVIPQIDDFQDNGYTREEMKMVWETQKIFGDNEIKVNPTTVRVPVFYGHSEAVHIETREKITAKQARGLLAKAPGVKLLDSPEKLAYPTPVKHASGQNAVYVGRVREDISHPLGLNLWVTADNLRKGAALNVVQIAELLRDHLS